jgi:hypothetical protein
MKDHIHVTEGNILVALEGKRVRTHLSAVAVQLQGLGDGTSNTPPFAKTDY